MLQDRESKFVVGARVSLLFNRPLYGNLLTRMQFSFEPMQHAARSDGNYLVLDREYVATLNDVGVVALLTDVLDALFVALEPPETDLGDNVVEETVRLGQRMKHNTCWVTVPKAC